MITRCLVKRLKILAIYQMKTRRQMGAFIKSLNSNDKNLSDEINHFIMERKKGVAVHAWGSGAAVQSLNN